MRASIQGCLCISMIRGTIAKLEDDAEYLANSPMQKPPPPGVHGPSCRPQLEQADGQSQADRRSLRAQYQVVKMNIAEGKDILTRLDSDTFDHMLSNVDHLHDKVRHPREQIEDAQAVRDISSLLLASIKDLRRGNRVTASELVTALIRNCSMGAVPADESVEPLIDWERLGQAATPVLADAPGMATMLGPMDIQTKQRKVPQRRQRDRPVEDARPEELQDSTDNRTETDKNMETMFNILREYKCVLLEMLVLNRHSFSQTVENIFALSFLVKDGRAKISIENGRHFVGPMNFPSQQQRDRGKGSMSQFVFRFDYKDWQLMKDTVGEGRELMPHRENRAESVCKNSRNQAIGTCPHFVDQGITEEKLESNKRRRGNL